MNALDTEEIKLTQYSHGAGCGCKISPQILSEILHSNEAFPDFEKLLVGNNSRDDAAVLDIGNGQALISTTDFFMPIVDDPYDFGRIASANAISDVYAMGGKPVLAIAILGWPIDKLSPKVAQKVIEGSRSVCAEAGIPLAGGHSIDSPEPIFGLAVNGMAEKQYIKTNSNAKEGNLLFLTKPLGIGILTTSEKKGLLLKEHAGLAAKYMTRLNKIGEPLGRLPGVTSMTDVTGFGLLGHLLEMCEGSNVNAEIYFDKLPKLPGIDFYIENKAIPGGTNRNWASYGNNVTEINEYQKNFLCDPQTSGGLLIAVEENSIPAFTEIMKQFGLEPFTEPIGRITKYNAGSKRIKIV
jgi:selenide, water dikinase